MPEDKVVNRGGDELMNDHILKVIDPYEEYLLAGVTPRELCPEAKRYEPYDWCKLSDNICIRNSGNSIFDVECDYYAINR